MSSATSTPASAAGAHRRWLTSAHTTAITAAEARVNTTRRAGSAPARSATSRNAPPAIATTRSAETVSGRRSRSACTPTAPRTGTARYAAYRSRPGLWRYTSPNGRRRTSARNHPELTNNVSVNRYPIRPATPIAHTRKRRGRSRSANGMASTITAPTYAPGVDASANGHPPHMPWSGIGRSSRPCASTTVPASTPYPALRLERAINSKRGTRIARFASGRNATKPIANATAERTERAPARTSRAARATTYATAKPVQMARPCDMCAVATCPHANAPRASHGALRHPEAEKNPEAPTRTNGVHARNPANGRATATLDAAIVIAIDSPPAVAAMRPRLSRRKNHHKPMPAMMGYATIIARSPSPHPNRHDATIVVMESHPDCASAANGLPAISNGFHNGTRPSDNASPKKHDHGSHWERTSGC